MTITTIRLDLAKNVFQVHAVDRSGAVVVRRQLRRNKVLPFFADLAPCLVGMEACGSAHHWARELKLLGHDVRLMPPHYVKPMSNIKQLKDLKARIDCLEKEIVRWHRKTPESRRLATIPGIGPITASALSATITDASQFRSGRQLAAWLGLVPRQNSSGGKERLGRISKQGDRYLRQLLVIGATSMLGVAGKNRTANDAWVIALLDKKPPRLVTVALANKMARIAWAIMARQEAYKSRPAQA